MIDDLYEEEYDPCQVCGHIDESVTFSTIEIGDTYCKGVLVCEPCFQTLLNKVKEVIEPKKEKDKKVKRPILYDALLFGNSMKELQKLWMED
jgi:hypothetical protein